MANFRVGQRVRIAYTTMYHESFGKEAIVAEFSPNDSRGPAGYFIEVPSLGMFAAFRMDGSRRFVLPDQIEPLTPPPLLIAWESACFDRDGKYRQEISA